MYTRTTISCRRARNVSTNKARIVEAVCLYRPGVTTKAVCGELPWAGFGPKLSPANASTRACHTPYTLPLADTLAPALATPDVLVYLQRLALDITADRQQSPKRHLNTGQYNSLNAVTRHVHCCSSRLKLRPSFMPPPYMQSFVFTPHFPLCYYI
jgi:hypothetical protein